ncbi:CBS domain-containing protein [Streptomyces sp. NPDC054796]
MKHRRIDNVMTSDVARVGPGATFKQVAAILADRRISGLPVVDKELHVLGVISETDLMARQATLEQRRQDALDRPGQPQWLRRLALPGWARKAAGKAEATTAQQLMSAPAITVGPGDTVTGAARAMARHGVERLPVTDPKTGRLVGIVTRHDLLKVFLRRDAEIRAEVVNEVLIRSLWLRRNAIDATVIEGVVTLKGELEKRSDIPVALRLTEQIDGVVSVVDELTCRIDDAHLQPSEQALEGVADNWLRKL